MEDDLRLAIDTGNYIRVIQILDHNVDLINMEFNISTSYSYKQYNLLGRVLISRSQCKDNDYNYLNLFKYLIEKGIDINHTGMVDAFTHFLGASNMTSTDKYIIDTLIDNGINLINLIDADNNYYILNELIEQLMSHTPWRENPHTNVYNPVEWITGEYYKIGDIIEKMINKIRINDENRYKLKLAEQRAQLLEE